MKYLIYLFLFVATLLMLKGESHGKEPGKRPQVPEQQSPRTIQPIPLRESPQIISEADVRKMIHHYGFYERQIHPESDLPGQYFQMTSQDDMVAIDLRHNLMWAIGVQIRTSAQNAQEILVNLQYAGYNDWRLPTLEELASLLEPQQQTKHYYTSTFENFHFDTTLSSDLAYNDPQHRVWSVNFDEGSIVLVTNGSFWCLLPVRKLSTPPIQTEGGTSVRGFESEK